MTEKKKRGFALLSPEKRKELASKGGKEAHALGRAHKWTKETAAIAGRKGGTTVSGDRAHMAKLGKSKGGN